MARAPRLVADGLVYHALNRGNNREAVFSRDADYAAFLDALDQTRERYAYRLTSSSSHSLQTSRDMSTAAL